MGGINSMHLLFLIVFVMFIHPFAPDIAKSKIGNGFQNYKLGQIEKQTHTAQLLSNEWSHFRVLSIESKVRKLCITQRFTLGVKWLMNNQSVTGAKRLERRLLVLFYK